MNAFWILLFVVSILVSGITARFRHQRVATYREVKSQSQPSLLSVQLPPELKKKLS